MTAGRCNSLYCRKSTGSPGEGRAGRGAEELGGAWRPAANPGRPLGHSPASHETRAQGQAIRGVGPLNTHHGYSSPPSRNLIEEEAGLGQAGRREAGVIIPSATETTHSHACTLTHACPPTHTRFRGSAYPWGPLTHVVLVLHFPDNLGVG